MTNIFNMVVESVVLHWESMVVERDGGDDRDNSSGDESAQPARGIIRAYENGKRMTEGGHTRLKVHVAPFYTDNRMVASTRPVWLQTIFDTLTGSFDWVGLNKNV